MVQQQQIKLNKSENIRYVVEQHKYAWEWDIEANTVKFVTEILLDGSYREFDECHISYCYDIEHYFLLKGFLLEKIDEHSYCLKRQFVVAASGSD
jgi:hypothetical protein